MKTLLVAPYPPARDGIASYAAQVAADLRRRGERVEVVSPEPSAAHHHADLGRVRGLTRLLMLSRRADRTQVHFYPDLFFRGRRRVRQGGRFRHRFRGGHGDGRDHLHGPGTRAHLAVLHVGVVRTVHPLP